MRLKSVAVTNGRRRPLSASAVAYAMARPGGVWVYPPPPPQSRKYSAEQGVTASYSGADTDCPRVYPSHSL
ncbi:MAG: hypothetical protein LBK73_07020 [Treponema sp.]|nr:hypothetical protein [Treponema sp.]